MRRIKRPNVWLPFFMHASVSTLHVTPFTCRQVQKSYCRSKGSFEFFGLFGNIKITKWWKISFSCFFFFFYFSVSIYPQITKTKQIQENRKNEQKQKIVRIKLWSYFLLTQNLSYTSPSDMRVTAEVLFIYILFTFIVAYRVSDKHCFAAGRREEKRMTAHQGLKSLSGLKELHYNSTTEI